MKNLRKILSILLILALSVCTLALFTSCSDDDTEKTDPEQNGDEKTTYTVTVKDKDGNAISGAKVQLLLDNVAPVGSTVTTGADGKAVFKFKNAGQYYAKVTEAPSGYALNATNVKLVNDAATVVLENAASNPVYTVYVKDASGNPIAGAAVQICSLSGACQLPKVTDEEGKIESSLIEDSYKAIVISAPDAYKVSADYSYIDNYTVTIVLEAK